MYISICITCIIYTVHGAQNAAEYERLELQKTAIVSHSTDSLQYSTVEPHLKTTSELTPHFGIPRG